MTIISDISHVLVLLLRLGTILGDCRSYTGQGIVATSEVFTSLYAVQYADQMRASVLLNVSLVNGRLIEVWLFEPRVDSSDDRSRKSDRSSGK